MTEIIRDKGYLMSLQDYYKKYKRKCHKCESCGKTYKLPNSIFEPRDRVCFSCELKLSASQAFITAFKITYETGQNRKNK